MAGSKWKKLDQTALILGAVHKLRLQEEGVGNQKMSIFVNVHKVENVNGGE